MILNKYVDLIRKLEKDEQEETVVGADLYARLMALYMYQNELCDAKYLWRRIPSAVKTDNKELERLHLLMRALLDKNVGEFFKNTDYAWSDGVKPIINDLVERTREDLFRLVGKAYTSIFEQQLMHMSQMSREQLKQIYEELGWTCEPDAQQKVVVLTKRLPDEVSPCASSEDQLFKLTEFVSFLEN